MRCSGASTALLIAATCVGVVSCEVGPNFREPPPPSESSYSAPAPAPAAPGPATAAAAPPLQTFALGQQMTGQWWMLFHSPALDTLVKQAVAGSWSLEAARARMAQSQAAVAAASSALWPQLNLSASAAREKLTAANFGLPASTLPLPPNFNLLQVGPVASYSLDLFGGTRRRIEQAQALAQSQTDELRAAYLTLTGNTVLQAIALAALGAQRQAVAQVIDLDRRTLDLVQTANRVGSIPDNDVVSAQTQLAQDEALLPPLDQSQVSTADALAVLLGRAPGEWQPPAMHLDALTLPAQVPVSLPSQLVHQRPDILAAEAQLHAASAQVGVTTAALYPDINLSAFVTGASLNGSNLFSSANLAWSIAAGLTQPIFDAHLRRSERREALAAYRASAADYQQTVLEAFRQVADLLQAL
ncbi:MAG TPA: efflux transporter outer membrane subunit, partial [Steroidobacteraceae bacterium]